MSDAVYGSRSPAPGVRCAPFIMQSWEKPQGLKPGQMNRGNYPMMPEHKRRGPFSLGMLSTARTIGCFTKPTRAIPNRTPGAKGYRGKSAKARSNKVCINPMPKKRQFYIQNMRDEAGKIRRAAKSKDQLVANIRKLRVRYPDLQLEITRCFLDIVF